MKKKMIRIPSGIRFLGDEAMKTLLPDFKFETGIYAKEMTGCGATTFALKEDEMSVILFVPRKTLLFNKAEQTPDCQQVWGDITNKEITDYLDSHADRRKVLISTYDSAARLKRLLGDTWEGFHLYVDEFHVLLSDASFKSYVELGFIEAVRDAEYQTWISATPCLDEFIGRMPHLKDLPFYQLEWEDKERVEVRCIYYKTPIDALCRIVEAYQQGNYPTTINQQGERVESRTMNGMFSSVNGLASVVQTCGLTPDNTTLIISETEENVEALKKIGFEVGRIPLKGEPRKMFTLCTSTAYMGVDFYGEDTTTFVVADCKRVNTSVDIATELVQITGRERLEENPFRKDIIFIHNSWEGHSSYEEVKERIDQKRLLSQEEADALNDFSDALKEKYIQTICREKKAALDKLSYTYWDEASATFKLNEMSMLSDEYEARVQYSIYHDGICVFRELNSQNTLRVSDDLGTMMFIEHVKFTVLKTSFADKMKEYCDFRKRQEDGDMVIDYFLCKIEKPTPQLKVFYDALGHNRIKALGYKENLLQEALNEEKKDLYIRMKLQKLVKIGDEKTPAEWKQLLLSVYREMGLNKKKATATQLEKNYGYQLERHHPTDDHGNRYYTYEITGGTGNVIYQ